MQPARLSPKRALVFCPVHLVFDPQIGKGMVGNTLSDAVALEGETARTLRYLRHCALRWSAPCHRQVEGCCMFMLDSHQTRDATGIQQSYRASVRISSRSYVNIISKAVKYKYHLKKMDSDAHSDTLRETNAQCARCNARCAQFGACCFMNAPFFHLVTAGCKHHSPKSTSRASRRAAGSKICNHPPPSARRGTPGDRHPCR